MNWNWSFRLIRLFRTDVRIHWSLLAFFIYYVIRGAQHGGGVVLLALFVLLPYLVLLVTVVMHEFGHVFAARHYGLPVDEIVLTPIGGVALLGASAWSPRSEFVIAACGPLVNVGLATVATAAYLAMGGPLHWDMLLPIASDGFASLWGDGRIGLLLLYDFVQMQMVLFLFNVLMVAYPLDGGRMVFAALWKLKGYRRGLTTSCTVAKVVAVGMGIVGLVTFSPMLMVIAAFVFLQAAMTRKRIPMLREPDTRYHEALRRQRSQRAAQDGWVEAWRRRREDRQTARAIEKVEREGIHSLTTRERELLRKRRERMN
jgi:stage IV sporulation protein FB